MPGGGISRRPLHVFILADCSGSMRIDGRMQALNYAIASVVPQLADWERSQEQAEVFVRAIAFADDARWHIEVPVPVTELRWTPLEAVDKGLTAMGAAFHLLAPALAPDAMEARALRPVVLLVSDGKPTDPPAFESGLRSLRAQPAARAAIRLAVAIGRRASTEHLARFVDDPDIPVLVAETVEQIVVQLTTASLAMSRLSEAGADRASVARRLIAPPAAAVIGEGETIV
jgi:uncharacterized protein YegL